MQLRLKLRFHTRPGQSLFVTGEHALFGGGAPNNALPMEYLDHDFWQITLEIPNSNNVPADGISYSYVFRDTDGSTITDWGRDRKLQGEWLREPEVLIVDSWNSAGYPENTFYTEPFKNVLLRKDQGTFQAPEPELTTHLFRVRAPLLKAGHTLCLLGSTEELGSWDPARALPMERNPGSDFFTARLDLSGAAFPIEYKYGIYDLTLRTLITHEAGENRFLSDMISGEGFVVLNDGFAVLPVRWKGAGTAIPVFSLRSESSFGIGEFSDLKLLADWCSQTGLKLIQILPVNDTISSHTWVDSYPYAAISAFALHPVYLNLSQVATGRNKSLLRKLEPERVRLNLLAEVDYEAVLRCKLDFLKRIYPSQKAAAFRSRAYRAFFDENRHWLEPYAVFCFLRDRYGTADSSQWPEHNRCTPAEIAAMTDRSSADYDEIAFHFFLQFHLHQQLQAAAEYAHERGIILKGDIAIGVARNGADTWQQPELYDLSMQAGAPPDPFADRGQNWGFPTYNWPRMKQDGFAWWKQRFGQMGNYFDAFRIDHILGFFRIWSIPSDAVEGILGFFVPAIPVTPQEFSRQGIEFDRSRLAEPFVNEMILQELFGPEVETVKQTFLENSGQDHYVLKPNFSTQRKVQDYFTTLKPDESHQRIKQGLFELISNVILLEVEGSQGTQFHFRFHMEKTASFRAVDAHTQAKLMDLYADYFFKRQDAFWRDQAMQKLPALKRVTNMLICGEDLGLVPACVPGVMKELGLLSLEIQRMPKYQGVAFSRPADAPYLSVVTPSTHDMSTIRGWWTEDAALTQRFYNDELGIPGLAPAVCPGELNARVVEQHLSSPAMWSIFQIQDLLGMDEQLRRADIDSERINIPANPKHYWRYRMHLTLESLLKSDVFNQRLAAMIRHSGR